VRFLHFIKHVTQSIDSSAVRSFIIGDPVITPSENGDAPVHTFFSGCFFTIEHFVGSDLSDCPDEPGDSEATTQYGENENN